MGSSGTIPEVTCLGPDGGAVPLLSGDTTTSCIGYIPAEGNHGYIGYSHHPWNAVFKISKPYKIDQNSLETHINVVHCCTLSHMIPWFSQGTASRSSALAESPAAEAADHPLSKRPRRRPSNAGPGGTAPDLPGTVVNPKTMVKTWSKTAQTLGLAYWRRIEILKNHGFL